MATFVHDPSRVHPPADRKVLEYPSVPVKGVLQAPPLENEGNVASPTLDPLVADTSKSAGSVTPRTVSVYNDGLTLVSVALGGSGEPHRIVYIVTDRANRNKGLATAAMTQVLADMDADKRDSVVFINNVDVDCDKDRLVGFFESLGYVQQDIDDRYPPPQLYRAAVTA